MSISERARALAPQEMPEREQDLVERFRIVAEEWADADAAYYMLDNTTSSLSAELALKEAENGMAMNKAEKVAKASKTYRDHVQKAADAKRLANVLRARMDYLRMREKRNERREINTMSERKLARAT